MSTLVDRYIDDLFEREGWFSNRINDKGGATCWGITRSTLEHWRKKSVTIDDVKNLSQDEARNIYRTLYFDNHKLGLLPDELEAQVFDFAVNSGPGVAIGLMQESLGLKNDGVIGPKTVAAAVMACKPDGGRVLNLKLAKARCMMLARIVRRDPTQVIFIGGWLARALSFAR